MIAAGGGRFRGIRYIASSDPDQAVWGATLVRPEGLLRDSRLREGFAQLAPPRPQLRCLGLSSAARRRGRPGPGLPGHHDRAQPCPAGRSASAATLAGATRSLPTGARRIAELAACPQRAREAGRARHEDVRLRRPRRRAAAQLRTTRDRPGAPISRPASQPFGPGPRDVRKAISRSTRAPTATAFSGTPASGWPRARVPSRRPTCSTAPRRESIGSACERARSGRRKEYNADDRPLFGRQGLAIVATLATAYVASHFLPGVQRHDRPRSYARPEYRAGSPGCADRRLLLRLLGHADPVWLLLRPLRPAPHGVGHALAGRGGGHAVHPWRRAGRCC